MNVSCPECSTVYRLDPDRIPDGGVSTRCRECATLFRVEPVPQDPGQVSTAAYAGSHDSGSTGQPEEEPAFETSEPTPGVEPPPEPGRAAHTHEPAPPPAFGPQDPDTRARRLARALVSDITVYNPEKWEQSREAGTLRRAFRDEILKSWEEYVEQVGEQMAKKTPYFRDALNDILARGQQVF